MATPTLEEFMQEVGPAAREAGASDRELRQYWAKNYGAGHIDTTKLPTWEAFQASIKQQQADIPEEDVRSYWDEHYGDFGAREKDQGDFVRGVKESFQQVPQMAAGLAAGAGAVGEKVFGEGGLSTALKNTGIKNYREIEQDIARESKPSDSLSESYDMARAGDPGALVDWLQHGLGYVGGQGLQALATAGIGYAGGKLLLKPAAETLAQKLIAKESARLAGTEAGAKLTAQELARQATSNVAGKIGQVAALGTVATGMEGGEIYGDLVSQAEQEKRPLSGYELARAFAASLGAGALEFVGDKLGVDLLLGRSFASRLAKTRLGNAASGALVGSLAEAGTEALQTPLEQIGKGQDPLAPQSLRETVDSAALGGLGGTAMGGVGGAIAPLRKDHDQPIVTERTPDEMGLGQPASAGQPPAPTGPLQIEGPPQVGELRKGTVYGGGPVIDASPLPDVSPILNAGSLDDAIANAVGVVRGATETGKARAAEFARMTARAKNETDALLANAPEKRPAFNVATLPGSEPQPSTLFNQPSPIIPGQALTPRAEPIEDPRATLAAERARLVAEQEQRRLQQGPKSDVVAPVLTVAPTDNAPFPSQRDLIYPSSKQVRELIHEKGLHLDTPVFREILRQTVGKENFSDLSPEELQQVVDAIQKVKATKPIPAETPPPQVPVTPVERPEKPYAPVTNIPEAQVPRSELTPEKNAEVLLRAEKAKADEEGVYQAVQESPYLGRHGGVRPPIPEETKYNVIRLYKEGKSLGQIAQAVKISRNRLSAILGEAGVDVTRGRDQLDKAIKEEAVRLYRDEGYSQEQVGRRLGIASSAVHALVKKHGANRSPSEAKSLSHANGTSRTQGISVPWQSSKTGDWHYADSSYEIVRMAQLDNDPAVASWTKKVPRVEYSPGKYYSPDFLITYKDGRKVVEEVKANYQLGNEEVQQKARAAKDEFDKQGIEYRVVTEDGIGKDNIDNFNFDSIPLLGLEEKQEIHREKQKLYQRAYRAREKAKATADKSGIPTQSTVNAEQFQNVPRSTPQVPVEVPKPVKVPVSQKQQLAQEKQKLEAKKQPEPLASEAPGMESQPVPASPERAPASPTSEAAPKLEPVKERQSPISVPSASEGEPFSLTSPEGSKPKAKETGPEQLSIDVPPPTVGEKPIIGREASHEEAPLFSKAAQEKDAEQTTLDETPASPHKDESPILDVDTIPEGTMVTVRAIRKATGGEVTVQEEAKTALKRIEESLAKYRQLLECVRA